MSGPSGEGPRRAFAIVLHHHREEAATLARRVATWLGDRGFEVVLPATDAVAAGLAELSLPGDELHPAVATVVALGGDGTMLRAAALASPVGAHVLGVNVGMLGYLTEVEVGQLDEALERLVDGRYQLDERMLLSVRVERADPLAPGLEGTTIGLNEAVVEKNEPGHTIRFLVDIDGERFTTYAADGLIVATPTGSTAYALSARGPIVSPRLSALLLTPVSPHMLFDRTLVLDPSEEVRVEVLGHRQASLSVDGGSLGLLDPGDAVVIGPAPSPAHLITFGGKRFHDILRAKFGLTDR